jgi:hypothetical protein
MPGTDIKKGDFFAVSAQAFCVKTTQDLSHVFLKAGDDARAALVARDGQFDSGRIWSCRSSTDDPGS